jgi:hypothetical protein
MSYNLHIIYMLVKRILFCPISRSVLRLPTYVTYVNYDGGMNMQEF